MTRGGQLELIGILVDFFLRCQNMLERFDAQDEADNQCVLERPYETEDESATAKEGKH